MEPVTELLERDTAFGNHFHFVETLTKIRGEIDLQDFFAKLKNLDQNTLSKNDMDILHELDKNFSLIPNSNIKELATTSFTSQASLSRLIKKIGFSSFSEFKLRVSDFLKQSDSKEISVHDYLSSTIEEIKITDALNK